MKTQGEEEKKKSQQLSCYEAAGSEDPPSFGLSPSLSLLCSFGLEASDVEEAGFLADEESVEVLVDDEERVVEVIVGFLVTEGEDGAAVDEDTFLVVEVDLAAEGVRVVEVDLVVGVLVVDVDRATEGVLVVDVDLVVGVLVVEVDLAAVVDLVVDVDLAVEVVLVVEVDLAVEGVLVVEVDLAAEGVLVVEVDLAVDEDLTVDADLAAEEEVDFVAEEEAETFLTDGEEDKEEEAAGFLAEDGDAAGFLVDEARADALA